MRAVLGMADRTEHHPHARTAVAGRDLRSESAIDRPRAAARRSGAARPRGAGPPPDAGRCAPASPARALAQSRAAVARLSTGWPLRSSTLRAVLPGVESLGECVDDRDQVIELLL